MPTPKREYDAVSAAADKVWQYRTGENLTMFDKDHDTIETDREQLGFSRPSVGVRYDCYVQGGNTYGSDAPPL